MFNLQQCKKVSVTLSIITDLTWEDVPTYDIIDKLWFWKSDFDKSINLFA